MTESIRHSTPVPKERPSRRVVLSRAATLTLAAAGGAATAAWDTETIVSTHHTVRIANLVAPCKVVQVSDLHRSWCVSNSFIERCIVAANRHQPDAVLLTGDFITARTSYMPSCARAIARLRAPLGCYAVLGNHDYASDEWQGAPVITGALQQVGVQVLVNTSVSLKNGLRLVGVDDYSTGEPDTGKAFSQVSARDAVLCMTHNPLEFDILRGYDVVTIAGHTHGGQIDLPIITDLVLDKRSKYLRGWFHSDHWPGRMYVSRGLGVLGIPVRINALPEIAVFHLVPA